MADESDIDQSCVVFIVDTTQYSGNFERELADYLTCWQSDQSTDYECLDKNGKAMYEDNTGYVSSVGIPWPIMFDEHGPSVMFDTPGKNIMGSVGVCFESQTKDQIDILTQRAKDFCDDARKLSGKSYVGSGKDGKIPFIGVRVLKKTVGKSTYKPYTPK